VGRISVQAQKDEVRTLTVVPLDGQPSAVAQSVFEDSFGFIWLGTSSGIFRYDGYEFVKFTYDPSESNSIPDNFFFNCFLEEEDGNLWIGSDNDLIHFNRATGKFRSYVVDSTIPDVYPHNTITSIIKGNDGLMWTGSMYGGIRKFNPERKTFTSYRQEPDNPSSLVDYILVLFEDSDNNLWVSSATDLYQFDRSKEEFQLFNPPENDQEWENISVLDIYQDKNGFLWFGTTNGLFKYSSEKEVLVKFSVAPEDPLRLWSDDIVQIIENPVDSGESFWVFSNINLFKFNLKSEKSILYHLIYSDQSQGNIELVAAARIIDRMGRLWVGTDNLGVVTVDLLENRVQQFIPQIKALGNEDISPMSFYKDSYGFLWVGVRSGAVLVYDEQLNLQKYFTEILSDQYPSADKMFIYSFYEDSNGIIWISHWNRGLFSYDRINEEFTNYKLEHPLAKTYLSQISEVIEDSYGFIWAGSFIGPYYLDPNNKEGSSFTCVIRDTLLRDVFVRSVCEDRQGNVWFGTQGEGLFSLKPDKRNPIQFINYRHEPGDSTSISSNYLMSVHVDKDNNLWIGSNYGLNRFIRETESFYVFNEKNGFDADFIYSIQSDQNGMLWLSTEKGLTRFDPQAEESKRFKILTVNDGLPFDEIYPYKISLCKDGFVYVAGRRGTGDGFMRFKPEDIQDNQQIPEIVLTGFNIKNESIKMDSSLLVISEVNLKHNENFFSFEFAALDYKNPEENQYAYMLEGLDNDWIYSGKRRFANYTGVPPGNYNFRVKGSNSDGYWNEEGISIRVSIASPPWRTWWAYMIYAFVLGFMVYGLRIYDLKRQRLKQKLEIEHVEAEKLKELDSMKSRFFANISHEFRTPLTLILGPLQKMVSKTTDPESKQELSMMKRNANRLQRLINQLLSLSKIESGKMKLQADERDAIPLIRGYIQSFESLAKQKGINLVFTTERDGIPFWVDQEKLEKILFNLLSNAFKYTSNGGRIEVQVSGQQSAVSSEKVASSQSAVASKGSDKANKPATKDSFIEISISDTGIGIPAEKLPHIFDRFYQADDSYTKDQEGTGIGLALTKELVELHHGTIEVESEVGKGTTFRVYLPLGNVHLKPEEIDTSSRSPVAGSQVEDMDTSQDIGHLTPLIPQPPFPPLLEERGPGGEVHYATNNPIILIVEDNSDLRLYIRGYLDQTYRVIEASDGKIGLEQAIENIPDLIISDVMMPEMDGFELSAKLKNDERTSHIPVILLTARASMESKIEGLETGADDFLTKPFDPQELLVRIRNLIDQRQKLKDIYVKESGAGRFLVSEKPAGELLSMDEQFLRKVKRIVENHISESAFGVEDFAFEVNLSRVQLHRKLKALIDLSASDYIRTLRLNKAAELIAHKTANIAEIAYDVGFTNPSHFSESFKKHFGVLPSEFNGTVK